MFFSKQFYGFTRLESLLAALLALSVGLAVWAVTTWREASEDERDAAETLRPEFFDGENMFIPMAEDSSDSAGGANNIPSLKGKTNMPAPSKLTGSAKKPADKPVQKAPAGKALPPRIVSHPNPPKKPADKPVNGSAARVSKPGQAKSRLKIPGIRTDVIDAPPAVVEMLAELENAEWSREVEKKLIGAVNRWARIDVEGAADFSLDIERRGTRNSALNSALTAWLAESPQAAQAWFIATAESEPFLVGDLTRQFYSKLAVKSAGTAIEGMWSLPSEGMKRAAFQSVSQRLIYLNHEQDVLDMYGAVESPDDKNIVVDVIMQSMARYEPDELGSWLFTLPEDAQRRRALDQFVSAWSRDYPSAAAKWVISEVPAEEGRAQQIASVVGNWVNEDPVEAAEWLLGLFPASRETDVAVGRFARAVLPQDPGYAAAWSFSVVDNNERWRLMEQIAVNWKNKDAAAAREYIQKTDLPPATMARLLK